MIETVEALEALDGICALDGVRAVYVGPSDLAISLGLGPSGNDGHPVFDAALARVVETCRRHGVVPGVHSDAATADRRRSQGFRMITVAADVTVLAAGMAEAVRRAQPPG
jgi:4-hydroxy-2-oxoheptanedioate aldolase